MKNIKMLIHNSETERNAKHSVHLKTLSENHVIKNNGGDEARLKWARHSLCTADSPYPGRQRRGKSVITEGESKVGDLGACSLENIEI